eukprot:SAG31_NODE_2629_length_5350_cov_2.286612_4_plen_672_part_00
MPNHAFAAMKVLSAMSATGKAYAARNGTLGLRFTSGGRNTAAAIEAHFEAQLWCAPLVRGCTESSATNFDERANDDDGSCAWDDRALLLAGFQMDPTSNLPEGWNNSADLDTWPGIGLTFDACEKCRRIRTISLDGTSFFSEPRFVLTDALRKLTALRSLALRNLPGLSGTLPWLPSLTMLTLQNIPRLSGTLPAQPMPLLMPQSVLYPAQLILTVPRLSGTLPPWFSGWQPPTFDGTSVSGTLPSGFGRFNYLFYYGRNRFTGKIPALSNQHMAHLDLVNNFLSELPSKLPPTMLALQLEGNPFKTTASKLATLVSSSPNLIALSLSFLNAPIILNRTWVTVPTDCSVGRTCTFGLQLFSDLGAVSTGGVMTDMRIADQCADCMQHAALPTLIKASKCHRHESATNGADEFWPTLSSCDRSAPMIDHRDGSFTATVPQDWIVTAGAHSFRFFQGDYEFRPHTTTTNTVDASYDEARTAIYLPRQCPAGSMVSGDGCVVCAAWAVCNGSMTTCPGGYEPDPSHLTCQRCPSTKIRAADAHHGCQVCLSSTQQPNGDQTACVCKYGHYDPSSLGFYVQCRTSTQSWAPFDQKVAADACVPCGSLSCIDCEGGLSPPSIKPGYAAVLASTKSAPVDRTVTAAPTRAVDVFPCPDDVDTDVASGSICLGGNLSS